jgi:hypothetical protein
MSSKLTILTLLALAAAGAAEKCADVPLCVRVAAPSQVFFIGEAMAERQREGHKPEYRFAVQEMLLGLPVDTENVIVETSEGLPPSGQLLIQATLLVDGTLTRADCDYVTSDLAAADQFRLFRSAPASLAVKVIDARQRIPRDTRIMLDGPTSRLAEREARFSDLTPGSYRITVTATGYQDKLHEAELQPGSCPAIDIRLAGTAELTGLTQPGETIRAIDADNRAEASSAQAAQDGRYRLAELPPGRYVLSTGSSFYPGFAHRADASVIQLAPGGKVELNFWLPSK